MHERPDGLFSGERAEGLDPGQDRLGFGERFGGAAAREVERVSILNEVSEKGVNERRLSESHVTADAHQASVALLRQFVRAAQLLPLTIASYDVTHTAIHDVAAASGGRLIFETPDRGDEPISRFGNGFDEPVVAGSFSKRFSQRRDIAIEIALSHETVRLHEPDDFVLDDNLPGLLQKRVNDAQMTRIGQALAPILT